MIKLCLFLAVWCLLPLADCCAPSFRRSSYKKGLRPLVKGQHLPADKIDEIAAAGPGRGRIIRNDKDPRFHKELIFVKPDKYISFKGEESGNEDHWMTPACRYSLKLLARNYYLRFGYRDKSKILVLEAWDSGQSFQFDHPANSLFYEGRALLIAIKFQRRFVPRMGKVARIAYDSGFAWVKYKAKNEIHVACTDRIVKKPVIWRCFPSNSTVETESGPKLLKDIQIGDKIHVVTVDGRTAYSPVMLFLDYEPHVKVQYLQIETSSHKLRLSDHHLIFRNTNSHNKTDFWRENSEEIFAKDLKVGDIVWVRSHERIIGEYIRRITIVDDYGALAPLTSEGNVIVNDMVVSCYASIRNGKLAHWTMAPVRWFWSLFSQNIHIGIHWYPQLLMTLEHWLNMGLVV